MTQIAEVTALFNALGISVESQRVWLETNFKVSSVAELDYLGANDAIERLERIKAERDAWKKMPDSPPKLTAQDLAEIQQFRQQAERERREAEERQKS